MLADASAHAGVFTVRRGEADLEAMRAARAVLRAGNLLGIFVEGTRQPNEAIGDGAAGRGDDRAAEGAPIIPVVIQGTTGSSSPLRHPATVAFGPPLTCRRRRRRGKAYRASRGHDDGRAAARAASGFSARTQAADRGRAARAPRGRRREGATR